MLRFEQFLDFLHGWHATGYHLYNHSRCRHELWTEAQKYSWWWGTTCRTRSKSCRKPICGSIDSRLVLQGAQKDRAKCRTIMEEVEAIRWSRRTENLLDRRVAAIFRNRRPRVFRNIYRLGFGSFYKLSNKLCEGQKMPQTTERRCDGSTMQRRRV